MKFIQANDFIELQDSKKLYIIDIREPYELEEQPFPGAINIPMNLLAYKYENMLAKTETYYIVCHLGQRSYMMSQFLSSKGYDVVNVNGGVDAILRLRNQ